jgi:hypothetical protein
MEETTKSWRKQPNMELHNLYSSQNITRIMEQRRIGWVGYVDFLRQIRNA